MLSYTLKSSIGKMLLLRTIAIVLQLFMVIVTALLFKPTLDITPLLIVIAIEVIFQLASLYAYRHTKEAKPLGMLLQLLADTIFLTILLSLSGGASNAFVSILLIPIVIAAVSLPIKHVLFVAFTAILSYLFLFFSMATEHVHHFDMQLHLVGMLVNFICSVLVVIFLVTLLVRQLRSRDNTLAKAREKQLQNEQILSLGSSAAQVTHQLATPIAHLNLLFEEISEEYSNKAVVDDALDALQQCNLQLDIFRKQTELLKSSNSNVSVNISTFVKNLEEVFKLQFPQVRLLLKGNTDIIQNITGDPMLTHAILNLMVNAAQASIKNKRDRIELSSSIIDRHWHLIVKDYGNGFDEKTMDILGQGIVHSDSGMGMALLLSNSTIERLNGNLLLVNRSDGASTKIILPIVENI